MNITEKITEIIKAAEKNSWINYDLQKDHSLSLNAPEGEKPYLEQKYFDLKKQIASTTVIGQSWAENYFNDDIIESNWIQRHTEILLNHIDEKAAWEDLQLFMKQYFNLLSYEKFIKDLSIDKKKTITTLYGACGPEKCKLIKDWFIERGFCDPDTFVWKDKKKSNITILAYYLKNLYDKGYTDKLSPVSIQAIAKKDFNVDMSISSINKAKSISPILPEIPATLR